MVAYLADLPIESYNSDTRRLEPKVPWMEKNDRLYWLWESEVLQSKESALTAEVKSMMSRMNHTKGFLEIAPRNSSCRMKHGVHTVLLGHMYGFYPREMEVRWFRGSVEIPTKFMEILPNPDGTFQMWTEVEVHEGDEETYKCQINHSSLPEPVTVECVARSSSKIGVSIGWFAVGLVLLLAVICVWMCQNKCAEMRKPRRPEQASEAQDIPLHDEGENHSESGCCIIEGNRMLTPHL